MRSYTGNVGLGHYKAQLFFFLKIYFYLFMIEREREKGAETQQREKQAPCQEPDAELDPRTPGSHPGPKAGAKLLSHPGIPYKAQL